MVSFRKGDAILKIKGRAYLLRLSLGALAEMDHRLGVNGPLELAEKLKGLTADRKSADTAFTLLECLLRPTIFSPDGGGVTDISFLARQGKPHEFIPVICKLFETSFREAEHG